jgi:lysozyme
MPYNDVGGNLTIGVGRNLTARGVNYDEIDLMLSNDIREAVHDCRAVIADWDLLDDVRQRVLADMCFNVGITRLQGFKKMLAAVERRDFDTAAHEMEDSAWAGQVGDRAHRLARMMRTGEDYA